MIAPKVGVHIRDVSPSVWFVFSGGWPCLAALTEPSSGSVVNVEARAALSNLLEALKDFGIFS